MSFSKHVGQEPASDLKSRIQSLCQEAGFEVVGAQTHLVRKDTMQESGRIIHVWIHEPGWTTWEEHTDHQMEIRAIIAVDGTIGGKVTVLCSATDMAGEVCVPTLRTGEVALVDLPPFLVRIAGQQRQIIMARIKGEKGPWTLDGMDWEDCTP